MPAHGRVCLSGLYDARAASVESNGQQMNPDGNHANQLKCQRMHTKYLFYL